MPFAKPRRQVNGQAEANKTKGKEYESFSEWKRPVQRRDESVQGNQRKDDKSDIGRYQNDG